MGPGRRRTIQCEAMGTLCLVATPIGNLEDITLRALRVLREADRIYAEDTRRSGVLLRHHGVATRAVSLHAHNEVARVREVLAALGEGQKIALISDAGSPLVSDPGIRLVDAVLEAGHSVEAIPGPSAVVAALSVSGLAPLPFAWASSPDGAVPAGRVSRPIAGGPRRWFSLSHRTGSVPSSTTL